MVIDVDSLYDRRADDRWNRTSVGDVLERLTYSRPDRVAITGWRGAFGDPAFERLTYREAATVVERVSMTPLGSAVVPEVKRISQMSSPWTVAAASDVGWAATKSANARLSSTGPPPIVEADLVQVAFLPVVYHVADQCLSLSAFLSGGRLVIGRRPVPAEMAAAVQREQATSIWGGSPQLVKAFAAELAALVGTGPRSSLRVVVYGWGALEAGVRASLHDSCGDQPSLMGIFGQTEAISCHRFWPATEEAKVAAAGTSLNYVGIPNPLLASIVMDVDGSSLMDSPGVPGEAVYRSPAVTAGYYKDRAATEEAFRYGWFHSGDSCVVDEDGLRIMVDRYKDIIKSGGENVSSLRVEALLHEHPEVSRAAVVGLRHDRWGEAVTAVVVRAPAATISERELVDWCRERLAGFETPKAVVFADALPETVGGKVRKYKLRTAMAGLFEEAAGERPQ